MGKFEYKSVWNSVNVDLSGKRNYEPVARRHGGKLQHFGHRFNINGGIHPIEARIKNARLRVIDSINEMSWK